MKKTLKCHIFLRCANLFLKLTITVFIKEAKGLLELSNLLFGQLISHGGILLFVCLLVMLCYVVSKETKKDEQICERDFVVVVSVFVVAWWRGLC